MLGALRAEPALGRGSDVEAPLGVVPRRPMGPSLSGPKRPYVYVGEMLRGLLGGDLLFNVGLYGDRTYTRPGGLARGRA